MGISSLLEQLEHHGRVLFDTNSIIYYMDDAKPYSELMENILNSIEKGDFQGYLSVITVAELFVKPIREKNQAAVNHYLNFLRNFPNLVIAETTQEVALQAAAVRAGTGLKTPDSLIIATAIENDCVIVGNDRLWAAKKLPVAYHNLRELV